MAPMPELKPEQFSATLRTKPRLVRSNEGFLKRYLRMLGKRNIYAFGFADGYAAQPYSTPRERWQKRHYRHGFLAGQLRAVREKEDRA